MTGVIRSLLLLGVHLALVLGLVAEYVRERAAYPRGWFQAEPYDPNLPLRGRYVALRLPQLPPPYDARWPVAFFIPEHVPDPSQRAPGEELWVEVTLPPAGAPRPIRLGVKKNGVLTPLEFR